MDPMDEMTNVKLENGAIDKPAHDRPVNIDGAAAHFGVTPRTFARWERIYADTDRPLPVHRLGGGQKARKFYFIDELNTWARNRCSAPAPSGAGRRTPSDRMIG